jgi:hypothetical protein
VRAFIVMTEFSHHILEGHISNVWHTTTVVCGVMNGSAINVMKVDNNFLPLLVDHGVSTHRNGIRVNCTVQFLVPNSFKY